MRSHPSPSITWSRRSSVAATVLVLALAALASTQIAPVGAQVNGPRHTTIVVTTSQDCRLDGPSCASGTTLREAFEQASTDGVPTTIELEAGTYYALDACASGSDNTNASGDLDHRGTQPLTVVAPNSQDLAMIGMHCPGERVIHQAGSGQLSIQGVQITGGNPRERGGGIFSNGLVDLFQSEVFGNSSDRTGGGIDAPGGWIRSSTIRSNASRGNGGGVVFTGAGGADATVVGSSIVHNSSAVDGGGIWWSGSASSSARVLDSAVFWNTAYRGGGGIGSGNSPLTIESSTLQGNTAAIGGAVYQPQGRSFTVELVRSTFAENTARDVGSTVFAHNLTRSANVMAYAQRQDGSPGQHCAVTGTDTSEGFNFLDDNRSLGVVGMPACSYWLDVHDTYHGGDPGLGWQASSDPSRPYWLHRPPGSPLLDLIPASHPLCDWPSRDQIGNPRPVGSGCDVGAIETQP